MSWGLGDIEDRCREVARQTRKQLDNPAPSHSIGREIALTLDHVDLLRERQRALERWLLDKQMFVDTQILKIRSRSTIINNWVVEKQLTNDFIRMLDSAEWRTQRTATEISSQLQQLQKRLLELWNMYCQLTTEHGDTDGIA